MRTENTNLQAGIQEVELAEINTFNNTPDAEHTMGTGKCAKCRCGSYKAPDAGESGCQTSLGSGVCGHSKSDHLEF
jgi:hypothetical protein